MFSNYNGENNQLAATEFDVLDSTQGRFGEETLTGDDVTS